MAHMLDGSIYADEETRQQLQQMHNELFNQIRALESEAGQQAVRDGKLVPFVTMPTKEQLLRGAIGVRESCPCGSGKPFGECHMAQVLAGEENV